MIRDRTSVHVSKDTWFSSLSLSWWPTYVNIEPDDHLKVCNLITTDGRGWKAQDVTHLFKGQFAKKILTILISVHYSQDMKVWGHSCCPKILSKSLFDLYRSPMYSKL